MAYLINQVACETPACLGSFDRACAIVSDNVTEPKQPIDSIEYHSILISKFCFLEIRKNYFHGNTLHL